MGVSFPVLLIMAEPTITQVFGSGATQTATTLTIHKAALATVGLTADANNTAESLFVAMLLLAKNQLTVANQVLNVEQGITVADQDFDFQTLVSRNNAIYRQTTYSIKLQKVDTASVINPNDY